MTPEAKQGVREELRETYRAALDSKQQRLFDALWTGLPIDASKNPVLPVESHTLAESLKIAKGLARKRVHELRDKLEEIAQSPSGIGFEYRLFLPKASWGIEVERNGRAAAANFWLGHLKNGRRTSIVLAEPGGFLPNRPEHLAYQGRVDKWNVSIGWMEERKSEDGGMELAFPETPKPEPTPAGPFRAVRLGDLPAMVSIYSYLDGWYQKKLGYPDPVVVGSQDSNPLEEDNLVIIGTSSDNLALKEREWDLRFNLELNRTMVIEVVTIGQSPGREMTNAMTSVVPDPYHPVMVSRSSSRGDNRSVTLINGGHPLAVQEVCRLLTNDAGIEEGIVRDLLKEDNWSGFPEDFQILFIVQLSEDEKMPLGLQALRYATLERQRIKLPSNVKTIS